MSRILPACLVVVLLAGISLAAVITVQTPQGLKTIGCEMYGQPCNNAEDDSCCNTGYCVNNTCVPNPGYTSIRTNCSATNTDCDLGGCCSDNDRCECSTAVIPFCMCRPKCNSLDSPCDGGQRCCGNSICNCKNLPNNIRECRCEINPDHCVPPNLRCTTLTGHCCPGAECVCGSDTRNCYCKQHCLKKDYDCTTRPNDCCSGLDCKATDATTKKCALPPPPPPCIEKGESCDHRTNGCCSTYKKLGYDSPMCCNPPTIFGGAKYCSGRSLYDKVFGYCLYN